MSLLFYGLFHKSDKSETRFLRPAPTEHRHKGWRCLHIWLLRGSNKNKKDQPAEFIIDHPELMSIRYLSEFALKRIKGINQELVCSITAAVKYEEPANIVLAVPVGQRLNTLEADEKTFSFLMPTRWIGNQGSHIALTRDNIFEALDIVASILKHPFNDHEKRVKERVEAINKAGERSCKVKK
jgi:hypothetical protein